MPECQRVNGSSHRKNSQRHQQLVPGLKKVVKPKEQPPDFMNEWNNRCSSQIVDSAIMLLKRRGFTRERALELIKKGALRHRTLMGLPTVAVPFRSLSGEINAIQYLSANEKKWKGIDDKRRFGKGHKPGADCFAFFGADLVTAQTIIITEGVIDSLTAAEVYPEACCISLGSAEKGFRKKMKALPPHIDHIEKIIVCQDNDKAGEDLVIAARGMLGNRVHRLEWPAGTPKDLNDLRNTGQGDDITRAFIENAAPVPEVETVEAAGKNKPQSGDYWNFEDAIFYIQRLFEEHIDKPLSAIQKNMVLNDILENQRFSSVEIDLLKSVIKKCFQVNKSTIDQMIEEIKSRQFKDVLKEDMTHMELADVFMDEVAEEYKELVGSENSLWVYGQYTDGLFEQIPITQIEIAIGRRFPDSQINCKKGGDYKAIARLGYNAVKDEDFFSSAPYGLPGKSVFTLVTEQDCLSMPYVPAFRQRWKLSVDPASEYEAELAPMFNKYINFALDEQQQLLFQELLGALITGSMKHLQQVILLIGKGNNGKSSVLDLLSHIFPKNLRCSIKPEKMNEDYFKAQMAGKVINIIGELEESKPIRADFKDIVACDTPLTARLPYQEPFEFLPQLGHIFSSNEFPMTKDHTDGFYRRWRVVEFTNKVPPEMRIPRLGQKIAKNELSHVLAWGLIGANRLIKNNFILTKTEQHTRLMERWQNLRDSVFSFLNDDEAVIYVDSSYVPKQTLYTAYAAWTKELAGVVKVGRNKFYERVSLKLNETRDGKYGPRLFKGIGLKKWEEGGGLISRIRTEYGEDEKYYSYQK